MQDHEGSIWYILQIREMKATFIGGIWKSFWIFVSFRSQPINAAHSKDAAPELRHEHMRLKVTKIHLHQCHVTNRA